MEFATPLLLILPGAIFSFLRTLNRSRPRLAWGDAFLKAFTDAAITSAVLLGLIAVVAIIAVIAFK